MHSIHADVLVLTGLEHNRCFFIDINHAQDDARSKSNTLVEALTGQLVTQVSGTRCASRQEDFCPVMK